jgi:hypothetical protein
VRQIGRDGDFNRLVQVLKDLNQADPREKWFTACDVEELRLELVPYLDPFLPWQEWLRLKLSPLLGLDFPAVFALEVTGKSGPPYSCSQLVHLLDLAQLMESCLTFGFDLIQLGFCGFHGPSGS